MNCNKDIHNELTRMGEFDCPFFDEELMEVDADPENCCDEKDVINDNGEIVCRNCGIVYGYAYAKEYINFYENRYKIRRKSIYHRKYHIENIMNKAGVKISYNDRNKIYKVFD